MNLSRYLAVLFLFFLIGLSPIVAQPSTPATDEEDGLYRVQPKDRLEIFVWNEPTLTRQVLVRPDGRISFPLVQDLQAADLTPSELKVNIEEKLAAYLESPNVTVIVETIEHYQVFVTGLVNSPGSFTSQTPITVLQAISLAGGFQEYADKGAITVVRTFDRDRNSAIDEAPTVIFKFKYNEVVRGKAGAKDMILRSGDVVAVP